LCILHVLFFLIPCVFIWFFSECTALYKHLFLKKTYIRIKYQILYYIRSWSSLKDLNRSHIVGNCSIWSYFSWQRILQFYNLTFVLLLRIYCMISGCFKLTGISSIIISTMSFETFLSRYLMLIWIISKEKTFFFPRHYHCLCVEYCMSVILYH
jgi:hypothetical protein